MYYCLAAQWWGFWWCWLCQEPKKCGANVQGEVDVWRSGPESKLIRSNSDPIVHSPIRLHLPSRWRQCCKRTLYIGLVVCLIAGVLWHMFVVCVFVVRSVFVVCVFLSCVCDVCLWCMFVVCSVLVVCVFLLCVCYLWWCVCSMCLWCVFVVCVFVVCSVCVFAVCLCCIFVMCVCGVCSVCFCCVFVMCVCSVCVFVVCVYL